MALIDFRNIINELSDESFDTLKNITRDFLPTYYIGWEEIERKVYIEKLGEFIKRFELKNGKIKDNDLAPIYANELCSLMYNRYKLSSLAEKYETKAYELSKTLKTVDSTQLTSYLEDITKIFVCFYYSFITDGGPVDKFSFFISEVDFEKVKTKFISDKPEAGKDKKAFLEKVDQILPEGVKDVADKFQDGFDKFGDLFTKRQKEISNDPVHSKIEEDEKTNPYLKRIFAFILLTIFYLRVLDFELGRSE